MRHTFLQRAAAQLPGQTAGDTPIPLVVLLTKSWLRDALLAPDRKEDHGTLLDAYLRKSHLLTEKARAAPDR